MSKRRQSLDLGSRGCARKGTRAKCRCLKVYSKAKDPTQNIHARRLLLEKVDANVVDVVDREDQPVELRAHFSVVLGCVMLVMHQECLLLLRHTEIEFMVHKIHHLDWARRYTRVELHQGPPKILCPSASSKIGVERAERPRSPPDAERLEAIGNKQHESRAMAATWEVRRQPSSAAAGQMYPAQETKV